MRRPERPLALALLVLAGCTDPVAPQTASDVVAAPAPVATTDAVVTRDDAAGSAETAAIAKVLAEVAAARQLPPKNPVQGERLARDRVIDLIMDKAERDLPKGVLDAQGDLLRGLGLVPADYDFVGGIYELIRKNVAGFYDDDHKRMYLLDDLPGPVERETLVHELEHALQDQHFDLAGMITYKRGEADRITAAHALAEGDAMATMFQVTMGSADALTVKELRIAMVASVAFTEGGSATPRVLQASLIAPYVDGFRFILAQRNKGGWTAVDEAFRRPPTTTEQLLHDDKYEAAEPAVAVPAPKPPEGEGWLERDADVLGEQGLRLVLEQWSSNDEAATAAAGWGGDRYAVHHRSRANGDEEIASGWLMVFDSAKDAAEAATLIAKTQPPCAERANLGPLAWRRDGERLAVVAGPFLRRKDGTVVAAGNCAAAEARAARLMR